MPTYATRRAYRLTPKGLTSLLANLEAARRSPRAHDYHPTPRRLISRYANLIKAFEVRREFADSG